MIFQFFASGQSDFARALIELRVTDGLLPFVLISLIIFAALQKIKLFKKGEDKPDKKINGLLALVVSAMIVVPHLANLYPQNANPILMMYQFLPSTAVLLTIIFAVLVLIGLPFGSASKWFTIPFMIVAIGVFLIYVILPALGSALPDIGPFDFDWLTDPYVLSAILIALVIIVLIAFLFGAGEGEDSALDKLIKLFKGGN
ncbi:hypothetical protein COV18_04245 [Candidatus Woesearchaeota archaeon CG10_big_fil_rev_8_21_14_0_10_37_12]|nr:MAG: hypothetical protein COV18_04245 [Candidatus Woesearchaeota archaeon CG10_big_fil_rev_8_21_14_0_10_37_12]